jgi:AmmeMemoRadiSam system protein A/AmmeMemoRadiSam system protein B
MNVLGGFLMPHPPIIIEAVGQAKTSESERTVKGMREAADKIAALQPDTIVLITPHGPTFTDAIAIYDDDVLRGDLKQFGATDVHVQKDADSALVDEIVFSCLEKNIPIARIDEALANRFNLSRELDHGAVVPLHFVEEAYKAYNLVCISYGFLDHEMLYNFGEVIQASAARLDRNIVVIASGDLSHRLLDEGPYSFHPDGPVFDETFINLLKQKKFDEVVLLDSKLCENAGECGKRSVDIMLGVLEGYRPEVQLYSYEGPFGVGYGVLGMFQLESDERHHFGDRIRMGKQRAYEARRKREDAYIRLAREAVETFVQTGDKLKAPELLPEEMLKSRGGTFVSIKTDAGLRGCMGTIAGTQKNIAEEIIENAIKAAVHDPRFPEIESQELSGLYISVDILGKAEPIEDKSLLDPHKYGVIVTSGYKRGLLLPRLKGIDTVDAQIEIALNKAGIGQDESFSLERFEVTRHE